MVELEMVRLEDLTKVFREHRREVIAVDGLNLAIEEGEFLTLLGPSGCGKTTTLRMIGGFETPTKGRVYIDGKDVTDLPPNKRDTTMVFQSYALFPHMTVFENVAYGLKLRKLSKEEVKRRVGEVLEMVNLVGLENRYPGKLSGGQQQRVALARALVLRPKVLLLDEPLSNLDAKLREQMRLELKRIQRETGITFVYVTHDQSEAMVMSDRVVVMNEGRAVQVDPPDVVYRFPANLFVANFIGRANIIDAEVVKTGEGTVVVDAGFGVKLEVEVREGTVWNVGDRVHLVIRPEGVVFDEDGEIEGIVKERVYTGAVEMVTVEISGKEITAEISDPGSKDIPPIGSKAHLNFSPTSMAVVK